MLVSMTTNHLIWWVLGGWQLLRRFTFQPLGFVSAAEGFVFLSGLVAGMVFARVSRQKGNAALRRLAFERARTIYLWHAFLFVAVFVASSFSPPLSDFFWQSMDPRFHDRDLLALGLGLTLLYQPQGLDILPMYCFFLVITPFVMSQIELGRGFRVLVTSAAIWGVAQAPARELAVGLVSDFIPINLGYFDILAWQFLFIIGLVAGSWSYQHGKASISPRLRSILLMLCIALGSMFFVQRHALLDFEIIPYLDALTRRSALRPLRLLNFLVIAYLIARVGVKSEKILSWRWLAFLGQHSLQVFSFQILLFFALFPFGESLTALSSTGKIGVLTIVVLSSSLPASLHKRYREWRA